MLYQNLVDICQRLEKTTKRLEKTSIIAEFLKDVPNEEMQRIILLLQGEIFPSYDERKMGVANRLVIKALNTATGIKVEDIENEWKRTGDLGVTAESLITKKKQVTLFYEPLTVSKVFLNLRKIAELQGDKSVEKKVQCISELLISANPSEAKYIIRTVLEELRVGIGEGILRDSIIWAFFKDKVRIDYNQKKQEIEIKDRESYNKFLSVIQNAYDMTNDLGSVAEICKSKGLIGLENVELIVGKPIKVMLAQKVNNIEEGFERVGKPAEIEYKLDGFRMQIHKKSDGEITIYTRRLENITKQFPDVVLCVKNAIKGKSFIIDSEGVGYNVKTMKYLPFQKISQRIKRKHSIEHVAEKFPVELNIFDIIYYNGKNVMKEEFIKRRDILERITTQENRRIVLVRNIVTSASVEVEQFYKDSLLVGNEGIMFKKLNAPYKPGLRVGYMVKYKPTMETLELVIVSAEWGEGKRANYLSSYTVACIDDDGNFLPVGKVSTGLKEKEEEGLSFKEMTDELKPLIMSEQGKIAVVKPKIVIEVNYEEIQKSQTYEGGYALRFPRVVALRLDRSSEDVATLQYLEELYYSQKKASER